MSLLPMRSIEVNEDFFVYNRRFTKLNDLGELIGYINVRDENGHESHLHPSTKVVPA